MSMSEPHGETGQLVSDVLTRVDPILAHHSIPNPGLLFFPLPELDIFSAFDGFEVIVAFAQLLVASAGEGEPIDMDDLDLGLLFFVLVFLYGFLNWNRKTQSLVLYPNVDSLSP